MVRLRWPNCKASGKGRRLIEVSDSGQPCASCYSFLAGRCARSNFMDSQTILIHLALKLGVAAAVSSSLVRSKEFKLLLFREERTFRQKVYLALCIALPIMAGVWIRLSVKRFLAGDLSFETALLLGVIG